jgi:thiamine biosynthesis lipoprotein
MNEASLKKPLFGKEVELVVWDIDEKLASGVLEDAYSRGLELQKLFNFYDRDSLLSKLNRKREADAPEEFLFVMKKALEMCQKTKGRYDISLGRSFMERKGGKPVREPGCSYRDIIIEGERVTLTHEDVLVDLGSIAKGYIADRLADFLRSEGVMSGLIDARGDIRSFGGHESVIDVQHPRWERALTSIVLKEGGVATSGDYSQYDRTYERPHILNKTSYISVTVIAGTLMEADAYATAIFVTPEDEVGDLLGETSIKAMCVKDSLELEYHNGFEGCLH